MKKQQGMVLLSTISIILLITVLVLVHLQQNTLYAQAFIRQQVRDKSFYKMEKLAFKLLGNLPNDCMHNSNNPQGILRLIEKEGCSIEQDEISYKYFIENLGVFSCLKIKMQGKDVASQHYRLTIVSKDAMDEPWFLQLYKIQIAKQDAICEDEIFIIPAGIRSWRYGTPL